MIKHTHKYIRTKLGKDYIIYRCTLPDCTHFLPSNLIAGKNTICWRCGKEFTITKLYKKPHCENCTKTQTKIEESSLLEKFSQILEMK